MHRSRLLLPALALTASTLAGPSVTSPQQQFGHVIGADYELPNYAELSTYWHKLARESDRMKLVSIGKTEEGRDQLMAIVSSPENLKRLDHYREISKKLATAEGLTEADARKLAAEGKSVVWIDGGLHASETLGAQQLMEIVYRMVSADDAETKRILNDCIILFVHCNPDGMDLVSNWYMRENDPKKRSLDNLPRLYQKYVGHDNNRDFYAVTQKETENMNRVMYREWFPQIVYNHHQTGPRGAVLFCPPYRPPYNYNCDPQIVAATDLVGMAIHTRFLAEDKPGALREGASYNSWWNGGLRTTPYFHNMVGILTETIGSPTPIRVPFVPERQIMTGDLLSPVPAGEWHFRQSVDYSVTANLAVLALASQKREEFLYGIYHMGRNSIERGRRDHWTIYPGRIDAAVAAGMSDAEVDRAIHAPELRDARAYVIPRDGDDFPTAVKFANSLIKAGVQVERATAAFTANGKTYPAGSLVVRCDQAFRPHVLDMFEPQDHPNDIPSPGAPPTPPYDVAGYTLAFQMGVKFDRILDGLTAPTERVADVMKPPVGRFEPSYGPYLVSPRQNDAFTLVQRVLAAGGDVYRDANGSFVIPMGASTPIVQNAAKELGVDVALATGRPTHKVRPVRVALWDKYGGSMTSGWIRWILEKEEIPYKVVFAPELDAGDLKRKFDVIILPDGTFPVTRNTTRGRTVLTEEMPANLPAEYRSTWGSVSVEKTVPQLRKFMEEGGTVVTIGSATSLATRLDLPIESALVDADGKPLPRSKYYVPGSLLTARVDNSRPVAWGMPERADFTVDESPVFRFKPGAEAQGLKRIAWYDTDKPLHSGWAWGQAYLKDGIAAAEAPVGKGKLYLFGPEITFRAQPHGTFRLLFNAIYEANAEEKTP